MLKNLNSRTLTMNKCNLPIIVLQYKENIQHIMQWQVLFSTRNNKLLIGELTRSLFGSNVLLIVRLWHFLSAGRSWATFLFLFVLARGRCFKRESNERNVRRVIWVAEAADAHTAIPERRRAVVILHLPLALLALLLSSVDIASSPHAACIENWSLNLK